MQLIMFRLTCKISQEKLIFRVHQGPLMKTNVGRLVGWSTPVSKELSIFRMKWRYVQNRLGLEACMGHFLSPMCHTCKDLA